MNGFLQAIASLCVALTFAGGMLLITPAKGTRSMRYILSLIIILVLCTSVSCKGDVDITIPQMSSGDYDNTLADTTATQLVEAFLKDNQINYSNLRVYTNKSDDYGIVISRIELSTNERDVDVSGMLKLQFPLAEVSAEYE